jgi:hypothetical protein
VAVQFEKIDERESWAIFDEAAQRWLHIDAETFVQRWDSGEYRDEPDSAVMRVAMLRPGGR